MENLPRLRVVETQKWSANARIVIRRPFPENDVDAGEFANSSTATSSTTGHGATTADVSSSRIKVKVGEAKHNAKQWRTYAVMKEGKQLAQVSGHQFGDQEAEQVAEELLKMAKDGRDKGDPEQHKLKRKIDFLNAMREELLRAKVHRGEP